MSTTPSEPDHSTSERVDPAPPQRANPTDPTDVPPPPPPPANQTDPTDGFAPPPPTPPGWTAVGTVLTSRGDQVPIDHPSRTSPLTNVLELAALVTIGGSLALALVMGVDPAELAQGGIAVLAVAARLVGWWFRTYTVTRGELLLDEGVFQRTHRVVPFSRIQQVELRQRLMARALGIATVHIETAGDSGSTAVTLRALTLERAEALRDHLVAEQHRVRAGQVGEAAAPADPATPWVPVARTPLVRLTPRQLLAAGATSAPVVSILPVVLLASAAGAAALASAIDGGAPVTMLLVVVLATVGAAGLGGLGAISTLVESWGFELSTAGDDLHVVRGLIDRRQHTMPRQRLQHARVVDNPVRRRLGTTSLHLHSAASPGQGDEQRGSIDIPLVSRATLGDLLVTVMGSEDFRPPRLHPRPSAARRRAVVRRLALTIVPALVIAAVWWPMGTGVLPFALVGIPWGLAAHRRAGHALDGRVLAVASGAVAHRLELIPRVRLQSVRTSANPLQRRADLASLHLDVAGTRGSQLFGAPGLYDAGADVAADALRRLTSRP